MWPEGVCVTCGCRRALEPVAALRADGPDANAAAGLRPPQLLLLLGSDLQRRLVLQAADEERRVQESGGGGDAGVCWRRGLQLHHGQSTHR